MPPLLPDPVAIEARSCGNRESSPTGGSSTPELPEKLPKKRKTPTEVIKSRTVRRTAKILRKQIGKNTNRVKEIQEQIDLIFKHMSWPQRAELKKTVQDLEAELKRIKTYIDGIEGDVEKDVLTEDNAKKKLKKAERRLPKVKERIQKARRMLYEIKEEMEKTEKLNSIFFNNVIHSPEYLREELNSALPNGIEELDHIGVDGNQELNHIVFDRDQVHGSSPTLYDLLSELNDKDNNKVDFPVFEGLREAVDMVVGARTLGCLEDTAAEIETSIGKRIEVPHIRVLLSAAIKEMENLKVEELEGDMSKKFKKWAATLNYAKEKGFDVKFAHTKLDNYVRVYHCYREK